MQHTQNNSVYICMLLQKQFVSAEVEIIPLVELNVSGRGHEMQCDVMQNVPRMPSLNSLLCESTAAANQWTDQSVDVALRRDLHIYLFHMK